MLKTLSLLACVAVLGLVGATTAGADYPPKAKHTIVKSCVKGAKKKGLSKSEAKTYCNSVFDCVEDKLSLKRLKRLTTSGKLTSNKKFKGCVNQAKAELNGA